MGIPTYVEMETISTKLQRAALKSIDADENGIGPDGTLQVTNPPTAANFTEAGYSPSNNRPILLPLASVMSTPNDLKTSAWYHWELSGDYNSDSAPSGSDSWVTHNNVNANANMTAGGTVRINWTAGNGGAGPQWDYSEIAALDDNNVVWDSWWDAAGFFTFNNGLLVDRQPPNSFDAADNFINTYIGGTTTVEADYEGRRARNFQLNSAPPAIVTNAYHILNLGDSLTTGGSPDLSMSTPDNDGIKLEWIADNTTAGAGYASDGTTPASSSQYEDVGMIATLFRRLGQNGIYPFDSNKNYAQSGGGVVQAIAQLAQLQIDDPGYVPEVAVCLLGVNDLNDTNDEFEANYKILINNSLLLGIAHMVIGTFTNTSAYSANRTQARIDSQEQKNAIIKSLSTNYPENKVYIADTATQFGHREDFTQNLYLEVGEITLADIDDGGAGYTALDVLTVLGNGGSGGLLRVDTVDGGGAITALTITAAGSGYIDTPYGFSGGTGTDAVLDIQSGNVHPNILGSYKLGRSLGDVAATAILNGAADTIPFLVNQYAIEQADREGAISIDVTTSWIDATTYSVSNLPAGLTFNGTTISGNIDIGGVFSVVVTATNQHGSSDGNIQFYISHDIAKDSEGSITRQIAVGASAIISAPGASQVSVKWVLTAGNTNSVDQYQYIQPDGITAGQRGAFVQPFLPSASSTGLPVVLNAGESKATNSDSNEFVNNTDQPVLITVKPEVSLDRAA